MCVYKKDPKKAGSEFYHVELRRLTEWIKTMEPWRKRMENEGILTPVPKFMMSWFEAMDFFSLWCLKNVAH